MAGQYQSLTIVAGTWFPVEYKGQKVGGCGATCSGCISLQTTEPQDYLSLSYPGLDVLSLKTAVDTAITRGGGSSIIISGKREPTRHPSQISEILESLGNTNPIKEIQTTGLDIMKPAYSEKGGWLDRWYDKGLRIISLSLVDIDQQNNNNYFCRTNIEKYPPMDVLTNMLQGKGFTVRWSIIQMHPYITTPEGIEKVVNYAREFDKVQVSLRPLTTTEPRPDFPIGMKTYDWVKEHCMTKEEVKKISEYITGNTRKEDVCKYLAHDAVVYNYRGPGRKQKPQNLALSDCVTHKPEQDMKTGMQRQLIYYPNGRIANSWTLSSDLMLDLGRDAREWMKEQKEKKSKT